MSDRIRLKYLGNFHSEKLGGNEVAKLVEGNGKDDPDDEDDASGDGHAAIFRARARAQSSAAATSSRVITDGESNSPSTCSTSDAISR